MIFADPPSTWPESSTMSGLETLLLLVGGPLLVIAVITLLVLAPSLARGPRYRPGLSWWAQPEWFGGPEHGLRDLDTSSPSLAGVGKGGQQAGSGGATAYGATLHPAGPARPQLAAGNAVVGGGASASW